jgi:hypothetical protein
VNNLEKKNIELRNDLIDTRTNLNKSNCLSTDDPDVDDNSGTRFGNVKFSRHEYNTLPGRHRQKSELSVEFKTSEPDGIIFYAAENRHIDYTALYLKDGKVLF